MASSEAEGREVWMERYTVIRVRQRKRKTNENVMSDYDGGAK